MASTNLAPYFRLLINGSTELTAGHYGLIQSVSVEASADGADELVIRALAKDPAGKAGSAWKFLGENVLAPGNLVTVEAGYLDGDPGVVLQRFRLHAEAAQYPSSGPPEVEIRGYSPEAALGAYTRPRTWKGPIADSVIVKEIAEFHGLTVTAASLADTAERIQRERMARMRAARNQTVVDERLAALRCAASEDRNIIPAMLECARVYCTLFEIRHVLEEIYGNYREPVFF